MKKLKETGYSVSILARTFKPMKEIKDTYIMLRVTQKEKKKFKECATVTNRSLSKFIFFLFDKWLEKP